MYSLHFCCSFAFLKCRSPSILNLYFLDVLISPYLNFVSKHRFQHSCQKFNEYRITNLINIKDKHWMFLILKNYKYTEKLDIPPFIKITDISFMKNLKELIICNNDSIDNEL